MRILFFLLALLPLLAAAAVAAVSGSIIGIVIVAPSRICSPGGVDGVLVALVEINEEDDVVTEA